MELCLLHQTHSLHHVLGQFPLLWQQESASHDTEMKNSGLPARDLEQTLSGFFRTHSLEIVTQQRSEVNLSNYIQYSTDRVCKGNHLVCVCVCVKINMD